MPPVELINMLRGYQPAALLMALVELEICDRLAAFPQGATLAELSERSGLYERPLGAVLAAAAALDLLDLNPAEGRYRNSALAAGYLVKSAPGYIGAIVRNQAQQYRGWADLALAAREGRPVLADLQTAPAGLEPQTVLRGLHNNAELVLPQMRPLLAPYLQPARKLLDVGCGAGTYGLACARWYPGLEVTLLDRPAVLALAAELVEGPPDGPVNYWPGDYRELDFGRACYDVVLLFQVLRTEPLETVKDLLKKAHRALQPGGRVLIYDTWLDPGRAAPLENVLQNLTMAMMYQEGGLFTPDELAGWLVAAGFDDLQVHRLQAVRPMLLAAATRKEPQC